MLPRDPSTPLRAAQDDERVGGEDRNRTYLGPGYAEPTTVLKTARTTRHPSLSKLLIADCQLRIEIFAREARLGVRRLDAAFEISARGSLLRKSRSALAHLNFLIAATMASKSGQSPVSSLE